MEKDVLTLLTRGVTGLERDGEGVFLYFKGAPSCPDFRLALHISDAMHTLGELRRTLQLLETPASGPVPSGSASELN